MSENQEPVYLQCVECGFRTSSLKGMEPWNCSNPDCGGGLRSITREQYNATKPVDFDNDDSD